MTGVYLLCWAVFPALALALCTGAGLIVRRLTGRAGGFTRPSQPRPIRRTYFRLALEESLVLTLYIDHLDGRWWTQKY